ncbi:hypothetical protein KEJ36_05480 [Candidatus Bathyarchaeota archaeon]|nr:hypothetical protein [Candidatus Bathyarchaeota archaeon]
MVWHKVKPYSELGLRLIHDGSLLKPPERLRKEVKRRLKDFPSIRSICALQMRKALQA